MDWKCVRTPPPTPIHRLSVISIWWYLEMRTLGLWRCKWGLWDMMRFWEMMRLWDYESSKICLLSFHHMRVQWKDSHMQPGRGPLPLQFGSTLIFPASKTIRNKFLLFTSHSIYDSFLEASPSQYIYFLNSGIIKNFCDKLIWLSYWSQNIPLKCRVSSILENL